MQRTHTAVIGLTLTFVLAACGSDSPASPSTTGGGTTPPPTTAISSIELSPTTGELLIGATTKLTAVPRDASGNPLTGRSISWTSSDASIASVDASGVVIGRAPGSATITAAAEGKSAAAAITVKQANPVATISVAPSLDTLEAWSPTTMQATLRDASNNILTNRTVRWTVSNPAVAT